MYQSGTYEDFNNLKEKDLELAKDLLEEVGEGEWQNEEIRVFPDHEEFAAYELEDGWYFELNINRKYNGAPNLLNFIDLESLGQALEGSWDESIYKNINGQIVMTNYGW